MDIDKRVQELMDYCPDMHLTEENYKFIEISGVLNIHRSIEQYVLNKSYELSLFIPKSEDELPYVIDRGSIDKDYPHIYSNGQLCLATEIDMVREFVNNPSLVNWISRFVEPYYVTYEYYKRYGEYPEGDRLHGEDGIVQSYMDIFAVDGRHAMCILDEIVNERYRGHHLCPCASGKKLRNCHGEMVLQFKMQPKLLAQVYRDYKIILERFIDEYTK